MPESISFTTQTGITLTNKSSMGWELGAYFDKDDSITLLSKLAPNDSLFIPNGTALSGTLTLRPTDDPNYSWQGRKPSFSFAKILSFESRNLLARCKSRKTKSKIFCILHLTRPNNVTSHSECNIRIISPFALENTLSTACKFTIFTKKDGTLNPVWSNTMMKGERRDIFTLPLTRKLYLQSVIQKSDTTTWSSDDICLIYSPNGDNLSQEFVNTDQHKRELLLNIDYHYTLNSYHELCIYCSYWITNETDLQLRLFVGNEEAPGQRSHQNVLINPKILMFDYRKQNIVFAGKVNIHVKTLASDEFSMDNIGTFEIHLESKTEVLTLVMHVDTGVDQFRRTKMVTFTTTTGIINKMDSKRFVNPAKNGEFYYGSRKDNLRSGYGIQIYRSKGRYFGNWKDDLYHGFGTLVEPDGSTYQGMFEAGKRKGNGTMYWPNGDSMTGVWADTTLKNGMFKKGSLVDCSLSMLSLMRHHLEKEWESKSLDDLIFPPYHQSSQKSNTLKCYKKWSQFMEDHEQLMKKEAEFVVAMLKESTELKSTELFIEISRSLLQGQTGTQFLSYFFHFAKDAIYGTYFAELHNQNQQTTHVVVHQMNEDVKSVIKFIKKVLMRYFRQVIGDGMRASHSFKVFLTTFVHDELFMIIFPIYELSYKERDMELNHKITSLTQCSPYAFGIPKHHLPQSEEELPFQKTISIFNELKEHRSIQEKIDIFLKTRDSIIDQIATYQRVNKNKDDNHQIAISADDTAPVMTFVFLHSDIANHCAYAHYLYNWRSGFLDIENPVNPFIAGYYGFADYILELSIPSINKEEHLVSSKQLCIKIEKSLWSVAKEQQRWIANFFLFISNEISFMNADGLLLVAERGYNGLARELLDHFDVAQVILEKSDLGINLIKDNEDIYIRIDKVYPSDLYYDISLRMLRVLHDKS